MESTLLSVINGNEKGGPIKNIKESVKPEILDKLVKNFHVFLDNTSGDIFNYEKEEMEWKPIGNVGLHYSRALTEISGSVAANTVKKTKTHISNATSSLKPVMIMTSDSDIRCEVKKNYLGHWLMKDIFYEFIVENINTWDPHPVNIT